VRKAWLKILLVLASAALGTLLLGTQGSAARPDSNCTAATTRDAVIAFVAAFNRGDYAALDAQFAQPPDFQWYSSPRPGLRLRGQSHRRDTLVAYFRWRHRVGDRLGLLDFQFNGDSGRYGNFGLKLRRAVPGFRHGERFRLEAKGALICARDSTKFIVMTFGQAQPLR
jgi:hypothetical protein